MLRCGFGRTCFLTIMTCSTRTFPSSGNTRSTRPSLPLSRPLITFTVSLRRILMRFGNVLAVAIEITFQRILLLQHFRREAHDLQELLLAQFPSDGPKDAGSDRLASFVDQDRGILVEPNISTVATAVLFARAHHDGFDDLAFLYLAVRRCFLDAGGNHVAQPGPQPGVAAERQDHLQLASAGVVGDLEHGSHHHGHSSISYRVAGVASAATSGTSAVFRTISFNFQRFSFESGRVSSRRTTSPTCASFFSSCA